MSTDEYPYESNALKQTHPQHLYDLGCLLGYHPPVPDRARILELACASGGNLIPMAYHYPKANFVGIDISAPQIQIGKQMIADLSLRNIELRQLSILDFKESAQRFDYIICHGLYSWVDPAIAQQILHICRTRLSENGLAYISYNTYPGWVFGNTVRDMLLMTTQEARSSGEKLDQVQAFFDLNLAGFAQVPSLYAELVCDELSIVSQHSANQLFHEHLSAHHHPLYYFEFMDILQSQQLAYVGDATFDDTQEGVFERQISDYFQNRRFRSSIICRQGHNENTLTDRARLLHYYQDYLKPALNTDYVLSAKPIADPLAQYQAQFQEHVTNAKHENILLTPVAQVIFPYLDGKHDIHNLVNVIEQAIQQEVLVILDNNQQPIENDQKRLQHIEKICRETLGLLGERFLLISA